jgi:hypothetical protein
MTVGSPFLDGRSPNITDSEDVWSAADASTLSEANSSSQQNQAKLTQQLPETIVLLTPAIEFAPVDNFSIIHYHRAASPAIVICRY